MINDGRINFLSRPRRFGKSLLISTIEELYKGNKKLFECLYIYDKWNWDETYRVIKLDFSGAISSTSIGLEERLKEIIYNIGRNFSLELKSKTSQEMLDLLILELYNRFNKKVVVLIDEYDAPLNDNLENPKVFKENLEVLKSLYSVLRKREEYLQFIFITGVSEIGSDSILSKLNKLNDLTLVKDYANICGYTPEEVERYLHPHIEAVAKNENVNYDTVLDKINHWYDGYSWDGKTRLFNPYSLMSMLKYKDFSKYWFSTGSTRFLINRIKERDDLNTILKFNSHYKDDLLDFKIANNLIALLFQTGYLTIKKVEKDIDGENKYYLDFPNFEVEKGLKGIY